MSRGDLLRTSVAILQPPQSIVSLPLPGLPLAGPKSQVHNQLQGRLGNVFTPGSHVLGEKLRSPLTPENKGCGGRKGSVIRHWQQTCWGPEYSASQGDEGDASQRHVSGIPDSTPKLKVLEGMGWGAGSIVRKLAVSTGYNTLR